MIISPFFDQSTATFSYVVHDPETLDALIIDPVLEYDPLTTQISNKAMAPVCAFIDDQRLSVRLILDTHVHADHMTGAFYLKEHFKVKSGIGVGFVKSRDYFSDVYSIDTDDYAPAYDLYFQHEEEFSAGSITIKALMVPGHTPSCTAYIIGDNIFSGDVIFQPTLGCGRSDFPGGSALDLYHSIQQLYRLPDHFRLWIGHDYPTEGKGALSSVSIQENKQSNRLIKAETSCEEFVKARQNKDKTLAPPRLLWPAMQINILGGQLPKANPKGQRFLKIPLREPCYSSPRPGAVGQNP